MSGKAQFDTARRLVRALAAVGVRRVFASPGSRSTPLLLAVAGNPSVELVSVIDERCAAFAALGAARADGGPSACLATSGSAGGHWLPALLEAGAASVPLVAVTADRPAELHLRGANQTTDQAHLFGRATRAFLDVDAGAPGPGDALERAAWHAAAASLAPDPGPVHLNVRFRKPLEPPEAPDPLPSPSLPELFSAAAQPEERIVDEIAQALAASERPLLLAGPLPLAARDARRAALLLSRAAGAPLLAEATSQWALVGAEGRGTTVRAFDGLLASSAWRERARPDLVVQLGAPAVALAAADAARAWRGVPWIGISATGRADPWNAATRVVVASPSRTAVSLSDRLGGAPDSPRAWHAAWLAASRETAERLADGFSEPVERLDEPRAVHEVAGALRDTDLLLLGNSLPVREIDTFAPLDAACAGVLHQRGLSGIDGLVSGTFGAAAAAPAAGAGRVVALIGDVAFAHDVGGLALAAACRVPVVLVVIDNGGGRLFDLLPIADRVADGALLDAGFRTPPGVDVAAACRAYGVRHRDAWHPGELAAALEQAASGPVVVSARVDGEATARRLAEARSTAAACATRALG